MLRRCGGYRIVRQATAPEYAATSINRYAIEYTLHAVLILSDRCIFGHFITNSIFKIESSFAVFKVGFCNEEEGNTCIYAADFFEYKFIFSVFTEELVSLTAIETRHCYGQSK